LRAAEPDAALGHGGLGRLAACFMESMATLGIPAYGYGIRYDHGLFRQVIKDGWQQEYPEEWLSFGNPWEFARTEVIYDIHFDGWVEMTVSPTGVKRSVWHPAETIEAVAYDIPIVGWRGRHVNPLRLWSARAVDPLRLDAFNMGDHVGALSEQTRAEAISKILYPSDATPAGLELRLRQEYFFVSASLLTWCNAICGPMETSTSCRFDRQSSSMTRIRASRFRNSCASSSTFTACRGRRRGVSRSAHSPTPTTRSCLKRSNPGRSICSGAFSRGTWRSSIASIRSIFLRQRS
jgi:glycogen/starch/alpha-glucan phosphorylase-like protein